MLGLPELMNVMVMNVNENDDCDKLESHSTVFKKSPSLPTININCSSHRHPEVGNVLEEAKKNGSKRVMR